VSVATTGASTGAIQWIPRPPPVFLLPVGSLIALCALLLAVVSAFTRVRRCGFGFAQAKFSGALTALLLLTVVGITGCGGGGGGSAPAPQIIPTPQPIVTPTPQGTFTITLTPAATTAGGTQLPPMAPIPLTLIVK
jgi:hypothetical protein